MGSGIFVTGTDTGVGKTHFCSLLVKSLRSQNIDAVGIKPFCCGDRMDAEQLYAASDESITLAEVNPVWLRVPAAPYAASLIENRALDVDMALQTIRTLAANRPFLVIEGVGGWRVPLTQELCISQFAKELGFPVVIVSANRLGTLNHTQLTVDSVLSSLTPCLGVVLNHPETAAESPATVTNRAILESLLPVPILGEIEHGALELPAPIRDQILASRLA
jgi:dethiobiotin synthetase